MSFMYPFKVGTIDNADVLTDVKSSLSYLLLSLCANHALTSFSLMSFHSNMPC